MVIWNTSFLAINLCLVIKLSVFLLKGNKVLDFIMRGENGMSLLCVK